MRAIVGIGNPGSKYINNRHNVGIQFLDYFNKQKFSTFKASKFDYFFSEGELSGMPYVLIKPNTYVNLSGVAALNSLLNYNVDVKDFLVIVDDINFDIGAIRIRKSGGDGGHNGLKSIIHHLASNKFPRLKIGIGNDFKNGFLPDYVLSDFKKDEISKLNKSFDVITQLIESFIVDGYNKMLNTYSRLINEKNVNNN